MNQSSNLKNALQRQVSRKEFLVIAATSLAAVAGVDRFTKILNSAGGQANNHQTSQAGFGGGPYGR